MYSNDGEFFASRPATRAEREVYGYIRQLSRIEDAQQAINAFYGLLFKASVTLPELDSNSVRHALLHILESPEANEILPYVINRCFYTIGNIWRLNASRHSDLRTLVLKASSIPEKRPRDRRVRQLVDAMDAYVKNDILYVPLQRQMRLLCDLPAEEDCTSFASRFKDYFFIYESAAVTRDIPLHHRKSIQQQRKHQAQHLNKCLNDYWQDYQQGLNPINPTRLSDADLRGAIGAFRPEREGSYLKQACQLDEFYRSRQKREDFLAHFHEYVMEPFVEANARFKNNRFSSSVRTTLFESLGTETAPITDASITYMCSRLLKMLVCNTLERPEIGQFKHLIKTVGHQAITAVLLKIVLFKRTVRSWFEDRFGILFHMWESSSVDSISWLVQSFEYMNVALALNAPWVNYVPKARHAA
ncbi:MAG: hypothetical protein AAGA46_10120 [Cyanobacteria bacterium P01_F01_bin.13]